MRPITAIRNPATGCLLWEAAPVKSAALGEAELGATGVGGAGADSDVARDAAAGVGVIDTTKVETGIGWDLACAAGGAGEEANWDATGDTVEGADRT
jgi:hypothetical protein